MGISLLLSLSMFVINWLSLLSPWDFAEHLWDRWGRLTSLWTLDSVKHCKLFLKLLLWLVVSSFSLYCKHPPPSNVPLIYMHKSVRDGTIWGSCWIPLQPGLPWAYGLLVKLPAISSYVKHSTGASNQLHRGFSSLPGLLNTHLQPALLGSFCRIFAIRSLNELFLCLPEGLPFSWWRDSCSWY